MTGRWQALSLVNFKNVSSLSSWRDILTSTLQVRSLVNSQTCRIVDNGEPLSRTLICHFKNLLDKKVGEHLAKLFRAQAIVNKKICYQMVKTDKPVHQQFCFQGAAPEFPRRRPSSTSSANQLTELQASQSRCYQLAGISDNLLDNLLSYYNRPE